MINTVFKYWALGATAVALVLFGLLIGRELYAPQSPGASEGLSVRNVTEYSSDLATASGGAKQQANRYVVPEVFSSLPSEWRTEADSSRKGYAVRFDPQRREVIVEQCHHAGYFDLQRQEPLPKGVDFCQPVTWSTLVELSENAAVARGRDGELIEMELALGEGQPQTLSLDVSGHHMELIFGSKNDLFQSLDRTREMTQQKQALFEYQQAQYRAARAVQQQRNQAAGELPEYRLPEPASASADDKSR